MSGVLHRLLVVVPLLTLALTGMASANTSHAGWPRITGMLLMNKHDQARPLDGRPGMDPFGGADASYSCYGDHTDSSCVPGGPSFASSDLPCDGAPRSVPSFAGLPTFVVRQLCSEETTSVVPQGIGHNELLGAHGTDTIHAGPAGDVIWGDYKASGQPTRQIDHIYGGPGRDFIYASHGANYIWTGGGRDVVHAHFGHGEIHCDSSDALIYLSRRSRPRYHLFGCRRISYKTVGY